MRYYIIMIKTFADRSTENLFNTIRSRKYPQDILKRAITRLNWIDTASLVEDLKIPPSNHLEKLKGDRSGQYSIRINKQYRICFIFKNDNAFEVEIVDYH